MPRTKARTKPTDQETGENRFYLVKCDLFDQIRFTAEPGVLKLVTFAVSSKQTIKQGLQMVKRSPFQTVFVIDQATGSSIFAITQNAELEAEAKKKPKKDDPPPPPPVDPLCCAAAGCPDSTCIVTDTDCFCIVFGNEAKVNVKKKAPFTVDDDLEAMLAILK